MLGDCYCAAIVEHLSKKELMACDAMDLCQGASPGRNSRETASLLSNPRMSVPELIVVSVDESSKQEKR